MKKHARLFPYLLSVAFIAASCGNPHLTRDNNGNGDITLVETLETQNQKAQDLIIVQNTTGADNLDFGKLPQDLEISKEILITSKADGAVPVSAIFEKGEHFYFNGGKFPGTNGTCSESLESKKSCKLDILFDATTVGKFEDNLIVTTKDGSKYTIPLYGERTEKIALPTQGHLVLGGINTDSIDFGTIKVGDVSTKSIEIKNNFDKPISISDYKLPTDSPFSITDFGGCEKIVKPGSCTLKITFKPLKEQDLLSSILIIEESNQKLVVSLKGKSVVFTDEEIREQQEESRKRAEEERKIEEQRKAEEIKKLEELKKAQEEAQAKLEQAKKEAEAAQIKADQIKKQLEEDLKKEEERKKAEDERRKKEDEQHRSDEQRRRDDERRKEEDQRRADENRRNQEEKQKIEAAKKEQEEARRKIEEARKIEEEAKRKADQIKHDSEEAENQRKAEQAKREAEEQRKAEEARKQEETRQRRENECKSQNEIAISALPKTAVNLSNVTLPYKLSSKGTTKKLGLLYGNESNAKVAKSDVSIVSDAQVLTSFQVSGKVTKQIDDVLLQVDLLKLETDKYNDTEMLCISTAKIKKCSGRLFSLPEWLKLYNEEFFKSYTRPVTTTYENLLSQKEKKCGAHDCESLEKILSLKSLLKLTDSELEILKNEKVINIVLTDDTRQLVSPKIIFVTKEARECFAASKTKD